MYISISAVTAIVSLVILPHANSHGDNVFDVIILGASTAGIRAAARLQELGITKIKILERSSYLGGIVRSGHIGEHTIDLGPSRVWEQDTDIKDLADEYLELTSYSSTPLVVYDDTRNDVTDALINEFDALYETVTPSVDEFAQSILDNDYPDMGVVSAYRWKGFDDNTPLRRLVSFLEHGSMDDPALESLKFRARREPLSFVVHQEGQSLATLIDSYGSTHITEFNNKLQLNTTVDRIVMREDSVTVYSGNAHFDAHHIIIAYSLGELQHEATKFESNLPDWKLNAIYEYGVTKWMKIYLRFPTIDPWFVPMGTFRFLHASERINHFMYWENLEYFHDRSRILMAMVKNDQVDEIRAMTDAEVQTEAMRVLRAIFGNSIPNPTEILVPRDDEDPLIHGGYSYWPTGYTLEQHDALKAAIGHVHFAGDYNIGNTEYGMQAEFTAGTVVGDNVHKCSTNPSNELCGLFVPAYMLQGCTYKGAYNYDPEAKQDDGSCNIREPQKKKTLWQIIVSTVASFFGLLCVIACFWWGANQKWKRVEVRVRR